MLCSPLCASSGSSKAVARGEDRKCSAFVVLHGEECDVAVADCFFLTPGLTWGDFLNIFANILYTFLFSRWSAAPCYFWIHFVWCLLCMFNIVSLLLQFCPPQVCITFADRGWVAQSRGVSAAKPVPHLLSPHASTALCIVASAITLCLRFSPLHPCVGCKYRILHKVSACYCYLYQTVAVSHKGKQK